jgi:two-component system, chemotaxis family, chemotaxis protein CheY
MMILIADDSATMRRIVIRALSEMGEKDTVEAENGHAALDAIAKGGVEFVITDWNMPAMNGLDFVTQLRASNTKIPVLMVTTNASNVDVIQALKAGVNNCIIKPFTPETMKEKIKAMFSE